MASRRADPATRVVSGVLGMAAAFGARKVIRVGWKKITGREPPEHPEDPQVALGEALVWGVLMAAGVQAARMLAVRVANRRQCAGSAEPPG
jgi:hypothetical protein